MEDQSGHRVRGPAALTLDPVFGPYFWSKLLSNCGTWTYVVIAAIFAYEVTGSAFAAGLVTVANSAPQLLAPFGGKLADRGNAATQIILGSVLTAIGAGGLGVWTWIIGRSGGMPGLVPVLLSSLVVGIGFAIGGPAMQSIVPRLIGPGELPAAMSLNSVPLTVGRAVGPVLGAAIATTVGFPAAFALAAGAHLILALVVAALRIPVPDRGTGEADYSIRTAVVHVVRDRPLLFLLIGITAVGIGVDPSVTLAPALALTFGQSPEFAGMIATAFGIGAGLGFLLFRPANAIVGLHRLSPGGLVLIAVGLAAAGVVPNPGLLLVAFSIAGIGMTVAFTSITTLIQDRTPDILRGRVMALWFVGFVGARPTASSSSGAIADWLGPTIALLGVALVVLCAAWFCRPRTKGKADHRC